MPYTDFAIVCGLSTDEEPDDWLHQGISVQTDEIWELQFQCCHKSDGPAAGPNATVIGSFVMYDIQGNYVGTTQGPLSDVTDAAAPAWTFYSFQYSFTSRFYVFPAIWWHAATPLVARYLCGVQMAKVSSSGGAIAVLQPDIFLTLGAGTGTVPPTGTDPGKVLGGTKSTLGPDS